MGLLESILGPAMFGRAGLVRRHDVVTETVVEAAEKADYAVCGSSGWSQDENGEWVRDEWTKADGEVAVDLSIPKLEGDGDGE